MSRPLVFITGASGFIGSHVVAETLRAGYRVRLSIRKAEQEPILRVRYADFNDYIETIVIPDLSCKQSYNEGLQGVDHVFHLASPMPGKGSDVKKDYVNPAVIGTESVLSAALDFPQIKKIVVMSSVLALAPVDALIAPSVSVQDNSGEVIPVDLEAAFPDGFLGHALKYSASKILAHQATRDFLKKNHPHYTLVTFHPTFVLGPSLVQNTAEEISGMNALFWSSLQLEKPRIANAWVHVRDVADAHIKALEADVRTGQEFILSRPVVSWEKVTAFVKDHYPALGCKLEPPFTPGWTISTTSAHCILGMKWRTEETIMQDVINQQLGFK
ncbi:dihydroflavonal-4-reductase [Aspergillus nomiae NRRL 13137]|uniref:Dihydroflavonal-4-reductase n=1 Tax=Aspergillus nomiae NRRL (strain ATCC 15546 / NRRL 13137 / CBS 260.88 / M93) TaxID=1509407 RepID=A0A0L1IRE0_ASPN3|nr:dihydroflavonal-4-reductase [Aspergillus nomiae NRRL 13137]KNG81925.1 dihydroflavonal-4-reductase [Aspergillus nomiae NRRL 13137]